MALSDRIALLRNGALEQVDSPRAIYARPATAYTAQFIGQTNLLRCEIRDGVASSGTLRWPVTGMPNASALFSLRPESIHFASDLADARNLASFRALVRQQVFSGASEQLELDCGGQSLRVRVPSRGAVSGEHEFAFSPADAIPVKDA